MDIGTHFNASGFVGGAGLPAAFESAASGGDWHGLHARLVAAHAAHAGLTAETARAAAPIGAFVALATLQPIKDGEAPVNPKASTDRKPLAIKDCAIAGATHTGGRGL